jgi:hypothetical protein
MIAEIHRDGAGATWEAGEVGAGRLVSGASARKTGAVLRAETSASSRASADSA